MFFSKSIVFALIVMVVAESSIVFAASIAEDSMSKCNQAYACGRNSTYQRMVCIQMKQFCDGRPDCPLGDDEKNPVCESINKVREQIKRLQGTENDFSGTGFMFAVNNLIIDGGSNVKMFNQNSDNSVPAAEENIIVKH
ncbi:hypothetical protein DERP_000239 [Dermatophagoides pteronyssinus]|uniref:Uncharacterized protein n=2 Tax=Dermatophagoides pteronyssinus TaxID=6956 RepID=A0ABQ8IZK1_DERPT|nr:uncharacterized protein LOC113788727 [Dermatophagoides pteronyssinus]KAH9415748.1 hypothetical protein DERP_000239 [Dermatophagoides pteronyssinus]